MAFPSIFDHRFYWGVTFNNSWTGISGQFEPYFAKPSLGGGFKTDYYFSKAKNIGLTTGFTFQQRGVGIKTYDLNPSQVGDVDSTHRLRLRFNSFEIPIALIFRSKKPIGSGEVVRFVGGIGLTPQWVFRSTRIFLSIEDGFHNIVHVTKDYAQLKASLDGSFGMYFNAGNSALLQADLIASYGLVNDLKNKNFFGNSKGHDYQIGIRITFLYARFKF